ncbi:hypothetical protein GGS20DRAFT_350876 [Poronia punctata]|nr:hypothetical protein GGS20DRAFT_350876 [Poronia punctata]
MAPNTETATVAASLSPDLSPSELLGDRNIRRSLVKIPSSQKALLDRSDSWASLLGQRPNGFVNVPPDVLEQVKTAYVRQTQKNNPEKPEGITRPLITCETKRPGSAGSPPPIPSPERNHEGDGAEDSPGTPISSWAPTERDISSHSTKLRQSRARFLSQTPERSPLRSTVVISPRPRVIPEFPPSSQGAEEDLELEVPAALTNNPVPVNKSALQILATPPSAQIVPCTFEQSTASGSANSVPNTDQQVQPIPGKRVYKEVPALYRPPRDYPTSSHLHVPITHTKAKVVPAVEGSTDVESSLSAGNTSSSIIPSTNNDEPGKNQYHSSALVSHPAEDENNNTGPDGHPSPPEFRPSSPAMAPPGPSRFVPSPTPNTSVDYRSSAPAVAPTGSLGPFIRYAVTYPSYHGTILDFVTACMYIQIQNRKIRTSLYDDFIRAWYEEYLPYVRECDESQPPKKALRAIDWYNEIDDDPQFSQRVVTRQNLGSVFDAYPAELYMAQTTLGLRPNKPPSDGPPISPGTDHIVRDSDTFVRPQMRVPSVGRPNAPQDQTSSWDMIGPGLASISKEAIRSIPKPHMPAPRLSDVSDIPAGQTKGLNRSVSETFPHKRKMPQEFHSEGTKRVTLGAPSENYERLWSDSGSAISNASERPRDAARGSVAPEPKSTKRDLKTTADPQERRRLQLERHFKKKLAKRESIISSSAWSNSPVSAQKLP